MNFSDYVLLQVTVNKTLKNAEENGYEFLGWTDKEISEDIINLDSDFKNFKVAEIEICVKNYFDYKT